MNGPRLICAACSQPTTVNKPVCDACRGFLAHEVNHPTCVLCENAEKKDSQILPADAAGIHKTKSGGHAGKCAIPGEWSAA